jgi:hypothetical protein
MHAAVAVQFFSPTLCIIVKIASDRFGSVRDLFIDPEINIFNGNFGPHSGHFLSSR